MVRTCTRITNRWLMLVAVGPPPQPLQRWVALPLTKTGVESSKFVLSLPSITPVNNALAHGHIKVFFVDVHVHMTCFSKVWYIPTLLAM